MGPVMCDGSGLVRVGDELYVCGGCAGCSSLNG